MWGKVCSRGCPPQKTNMVDHYLEGFYLCGMTLVNVAERYAVTPKAVENALKRFDKEAYLMERARRKEENRQKRQQKDRERKRTPEGREKDRERKQQEREKGLSYVIAVKKAMRNQIVNQAMRIAIRNHLQQCGDEHTAWAATIVAPPIIPHPEPHTIAGMPDEMTKSMAGKACGYEARADRAGMAGVPGQAIIELYRLIESNEDNLDLIRYFAVRAVEGAGYINVDATLDQVEQITTRLVEPKEWYQQWNTMKEYATDWAPKNDPLPREGIPQSWKHPAFKPGCCFNASGGTGKKGKGGGKQDQASAVAFSAKSRV